MTELTTRNSAGLGQNAMDAELPAPEALDTALMETEDKTPITSYYTPNGHYEMHDPNLPAQELPALES